MVVSILGLRSPLATQLHTAIRLGILSKRI